MKRYLKLSLLLTLLILLFPHSSFPCHGKMRWRFLPLEQARKEVAKLEAMAKKEQEEFIPELFPPEVGQWIKYYNNPIFKPGPRGSWEDKSVDCFTVGIFEGKYMMWYVGTPKNLHCQIGLATSSDGINWSRCPENPVLKTGPPGSWDEAILICQDILFDEQENVYKMWYVGVNLPGNWGIGYATSPDGIHWTKYPENPVLTVTEPWEGTLLEGQDVMKTGSGYMMWYGGIDVYTDRCSIGLATSIDGIHWTKYPGNPVLTPDIPAKWDGFAVDTPDIHLVNGIYHMWYRGWRKPDGISWIGHATSSDGINWERDPLNPTLLTNSLPGTWDNYQLYRSRVILGKERKVGVGRIIDKMWFTGRTYNLTAQVGLALQIHEFEKDDISRKRFPNITQDRLDMSIEVKSKEMIEIHYFTPWLKNISLTIYNSSGEKVKTLAREMNLPGFYYLVWNGRDENNEKVGQGLYFCEIQTDSFLMTKEIVIGK